MSQTRRLAVILAADVAGYSRLIGADDGGTLQGSKRIKATANRRCPHTKVDAAGTSNSTNVRLTRQKA